MSSVAAPVVPTGAWDGPWYQYEWLVVVGCIMAFAMAWAMGANDVANAFGTAVGARTITLWQACIIAAIFEFTGAVALGDQVTKTVAGSITSPDYFSTVPEVFAFGMLCALVAAWFWVTLATYLELAVSSTHSIIGAIMGFGLVYGGKNAIIWNEPTDTFPYVRGLLPVIISWFTSPICAGVCSAVLFLINRTAILRRHNPHILAFWALPPLVFITIFVNVFFVLYKGASSELASWPATQDMWVAMVVAGGCAVLAFPVTLYLKRRHQAQLDKFVSPVDMLPDLAMNSKDWNMDMEPVGFWGRLKARMIYSLTVDVHEDVHKDERVAHMHSAAEVFDPRAEEVFKYLQVFSSCCVSFAHGANDVGNAIGPLAAIWYVFQNEAVAPTVTAPKWILALGGAGIVVGLATYGYNIIKVLGVKMAKMTPSRGYCAELATAFTVAVCSVYGLPVSTTHCIVGAEAGVGIVEGVSTGLNWMLLAKTVCAWVVTLAVAGLVSAAVFAFGSYSPSLDNLTVLSEYQQALLTRSLKAIAQLNATNYGNQATLGRFNTQLNTTLSEINASFSQIFDGGLVDDGTVMALAQMTAGIYYNQTVPVVGFNRTAAFNTTQAITVPT